MQLISKSLISPPSTLVGLLLPNSTIGVSYTKPRILVDSIRSPNKLLELSMESFRSPSGVHMDSMWTSPNIATITWSPSLLLGSRYPPSRILMESKCSRTPDSVLPTLEQESSWTPRKLPLNAKLI